MEPEHPDFHSISASSEDVPSMSQPDPSQIQGIQGTIVGILVVMAGVVKGRRPSGIILQAPGQEMMPLPRFGT